MPKHIEIERRYIARDVRVPKGGPSRIIVQGYFQTPPHATVRIRRTNGRFGTYELTTKLGQGRKREEDNHLILDRQLGQRLLETCPYQLTKRRYVRGRWEIDRYAGPLKGLYVLESELTSADEALTLPPWVDPSGVVEVTNDVTNYDLARLATLLQDLPDAPSAYELIAQRLPVVVFTGGPCSGKSAMLTLFRRELGRVFHSLPETATIIIRDVGTRFPAGNGLFMRQFQQQVYRIQTSFELLGTIEAKLQGKRAIVVDRGTADSIAYMTGGVQDFEQTCQTTLATEYGRYAAIICLAVPPEEVYNRFSADNPARYESYADAVATGERTRAAWAGHPNFHYVDDTDWGAKVDHARAILTALVH